MVWSKNNLTYSRPMSPGRDTILTEELCDRLCAAVKVHPSKKLACQACGISWKTVERWLQVSALPGAKECYVVFAQRFGAAEAELARTEFKAFRESTKTADSRSASDILKYMTLRFPSIMREKEIIDVLDSGDIASEKRAALLASPPPRMLAELSANGWWQFPKDLDAEDRVVLVAMRAKYNKRQTDADLTESTPACLPEKTTD